MRCNSRTAIAPAPLPSYVFRNMHAFSYGGRSERKNMRKGREEINPVRCISLTASATPSPQPTDLSYNVSRKTHPLQSRGRSENKERNKERKGREQYGAVDLAYSISTHTPAPPFYPQTSSTMPPEQPTPLSHGGRSETKERNKERNGGK